MTTETAHLPQVDAVRSTVCCTSNKANFYI